MAKRPVPPDETPETAAVPLNEPGSTGSAQAAPEPGPEPGPASGATPRRAAAPEAVPMPENIWLHGLLLLVVLALTRVAQALIVLCALFQFCWMLFAKRHNAAIASFGEGLANWVAIAARYVTGTAATKPFPWTAWK